MDDLKPLVLALKRANAPGLLVQYGQQASGILAFDVLVKAMPLSVIPPSVPKGLPGSFITTPQMVTYICRVCHSRQFDKPGAAPRCKKGAFSHGVMERE